MATSPTSRGPGSPGNPDKINPLAAVVFAIVGLAVAWWLAKRVFGFVLFWLKFGVLIAIIGGIWYGVSKLGKKKP
jgi:hypothetical protein